MLKQVREVCERFGIPFEVLGRLEVESGQGAVFVATREAMRFDAVRPMRKGMRLLRVFPHSLKPTTFAMQLLGQYATRNRVDLDEGQAVRAISGEELEVESDASDGYVLMRCRGFVVGVGLYRRPVLKSQVPRHRPVE